MSPKNVQTRVLKRSDVIPLAPNHTIAGKIRRIHTASKTPFSMILPAISPVPFSMMLPAPFAELPPNVLSI